MDLTGWLEYFVAGLSTQLEEARTRGTAVIRADVAARAKGLNARQAAVLAEIYMAGGRALADLAPAFPTVTRRTLQRDLSALLAKGLVREGGGASTAPNRHYLPAEL